MKYLRWIPVFGLTAGNILRCFDIAGGVTEGQQVHKKYCHESFPEFTFGTV